MKEEAQGKYSVSLQLIKINEKKVFSEYLMNKIYDYMNAHMQTVTYVSEFPSLFKKIWS